MAVVLLVVPFSGCVVPPTTFTVSIHYTVLDDSDPWPKGDGEWYFLIAATTIPLYAGGYPDTGWVVVVEGNTYKYNIATITTTVIPLSLTIEVMEFDDLIDVDDNLGIKTFQTFSIPQTFLWEPQYFTATVSVF